MDAQFPTAKPSEPRLELGIDDALLLGLGRVVVMWGYVEMLLGRMLAQLCGAEPSAMLSVAGDLSDEALVMNVARLLRLKLPPEAQEQVQQVIADADVLRREWELVVRGQWDRGSEPHTAAVAAPHPGRREIVRVVTIGEAELSDIEEHARLVVSELTRLCLQLGVRFDVPA